MEFEWDDGKARQNERNHRVSFEEAKTIFADPRVVVRFDLEHSRVEDRWHAIGISNRGRLLLVSYTKREPDIRIISARRAERIHREAYEEQEA